VLVARDIDCHGVRRALELMLAERFGVEHTTLQVDHASPAGLLQLRSSKP
jgi:cobalt-zinc-cadmium efflux system protein